MTFYKYDQNNSGGSFIGPAIQVFIEANSPEEANKIAIQNDIYFDGENGNYVYDCRCCGPRWYKAEDLYSIHYSEESEIPLPSVYHDEWASDHLVPVRKIIRKD